MSPYDADTRRGTLPAELTLSFNADITSLVAEVTDDKGFDKAVRKKLQVEHAVREHVQQC